jgi:hypothetical protein
MLTVNQQGTYIMEEKSKNTFYLDPDYENFVPRKTRLKWESINGGKPKYTDLKIFMGIHLSLMLIPLCIILLGSLGWSFDAEGVNTLFMVTHCERLSPESSQVKVKYSYTVDGAIFSGTKNSDVNMTCEDFPVGTLIEGQYLLTKPEISRVIQSDFFSMWDEDWGGFILVIICVPFLVSVWGIIGHLWLILKYHRFKTRGIVLDGEFLSSWRVRVPSKSLSPLVVPSLVVDYQYKTPDGRMQINRFIDNSGRLLSRKMPGVLTPIKVLYANDKTVIML